MNYTYDVRKCVQIPEGWEQQADTSTFEQAQRFLRMRGWREYEYDLWQQEAEGSTARVSLRRGGLNFSLSIRLDGGLWECLTDDVPLADLPYVLIAEDVMLPECPNCGESGGEPREYRSREWQGCAEHGGMVNTVEYYCSRCPMMVELPEQEDDDDDAELPF